MRRSSAVNSEPAWQLGAGLENDLIEKEGIVWKAALLRLTDRFMVCGGESKCLFVFGSLWYRDSSLRRTDSSKTAGLKQSGLVIGYRLGGSGTGRQCFWTAEVACLLTMERHIDLMVSFNSSRLPCQDHASASAFFSSIPSWFRSLASS